ncbi:hypothetical protein FA15DRAFT_595049, partial [Coprinopsis marcescibilis]
VMVFYDMALTSGQEIQVIWMAPKYNYMTILWALNQYLTPIGYIIIIIIILHPVPETLKIITAFVIGVIFIIRIHTLYGKKKLITGVVCGLLAVQLAVKTWAFTDGTRLVLPGGLVGCILTGKHGFRMAFTWIGELFFDTVIFAMTLWRAISYYRLQKRNPKSLFTLIGRDGVVYFGVIFAANVMNVSFYLAAQPDLKAVNASFSTL